MSYDESDFRSANTTLKAAPKIITPPNSFDKKRIPKAVLSLNTKPTYSTQHGNIAENLFGKFLYDRAEFYTIKKPKNQIFSSNIHSIKLVYLDKNLYKTKYELANNIVSELVNEYGKFTITGFDFSNRDIISKFEHSSSKKGNLLLFKSINNYQLIWNLANLDIVYRVNTTNNKSIFEYTKRRKDYETKFWAMEHGL